MTKKPGAVLESPTTEETALALVDEAPTDLVPSQALFTADYVFDKEDISYAKLKLLQFLSPEVTDPESTLKAGQWFITGDEAGRKDIVVVPMLFSLSRRYQVGPNDDKQTLCMSSDGVTGMKMAEGGPGGNCKTCPMSFWVTDPITSKRLLPCQPTYSYLCYVPDFGSIVSLSLSRTASSMAKDLNGHLSVRGFGGKFAIKLGSSQVKNASNSYFVPTMRLHKVEDSVLQDARMLMGLD